MKKRTLALLLGVAAAVSLTACSGEESPSVADDPAEPLDLTGSWSVSTDDGSAMTATISSDTIVVNWVIDGNEMLYWSGSYDAPTEPGDTYTWTSQADGAADTALLASSDDTKDFSYKAGTLSFELTVQGETGTIEMQRTDDQAADTSADADGTDADTLAVGDTWTVDGQWSMTINSVTPTGERNEFSDKEPAAVYLIEYTYTNLGYEDDIMDGLYMDLAMEASVVDCAGTMGYSYPCNITDYPQETPVGATCNAQEFVGVDNAGDFTLTVNKYDGDNHKQTVTFKLVVE